MHIGLSRPPTPPRPAPDVDGARVAVLAEQAGFESIFYGEHPVSPAGQPGFATHAAGVPFFQDTLVMLARASALTTRIKLGGGVFLIPLHQPVLFAKQLASLDFYSGGRLIIGAGAGWSRVQCEAMGGDFDRRWAQAREAIQLMKRLWSEDVVEHHGEFFHVPPIRLEPKPASRPWPPVLLPGPAFNSVEPFDAPRSLTAFRRIVSYGDGWLPARVGQTAIEDGPLAIAAGLAVLTGLCKDAGRDPGDLRTTVLLRPDLQDGDMNWPVLPERDTLRRYEDAGAERAIVTLPTILDERHAEQVVGRMAEALL